MGIVGGGGIILLEIGEVGVRTVQERYQSIKKNQFKMGDLEPSDFQMLKPSVRMGFMVIDGCFSKPIDWLSGCYVVERLIVKLITLEE
jgi:hypothetical protein